LYLSTGAAPADIAGCSLPSEERLCHRMALPLYLPALKVLHTSPGSIIPTEQTCHNFTITLILYTHTVPRNEIAKDVSAITKQKTSM
jgi:hypothetical protein